MQPITKASLDPQCDDIRNLQADQEWCGVRGYFALVSGWPQLFHSMRASRQTELQRQFPLHVVLLLAWQLTTHRKAELSAGHRGYLGKSGWRGEGGSIIQAGLRGEGTERGIFTRFIRDPFLSYSSSAVRIVDQFSGSTSTNGRLNLRAFIASSAGRQFLRK